MKIVNVINAGTPANVNVTGTSFDLGDLTSYSIAVDFTDGAGNLAGTLTLEASNDNSDFVTIVGSNQAVSNSQSHVWNVTGASYRFVRPVWVYSSGTGNIKAKLVAKEQVIVGA
jgi:hypothetical protein